MSIPTNLNSSLFYIFYFMWSVFFYGQRSEKEVQDSLVTKITLQSSDKRLASIAFLCDEFAQKKPKLVLTYIHQGIELAKKLENEEVLINLYRNKGVSKGILGQMDDALVYLNKASAGAKRIKDTILMARSALSLGNHYTRLGDFKEAELHYLNAKILGRKSSDLVTVYASKFNIAASYISRGLHKNALKIYDELLVLCPNEAIECNGVLFNKAICTYMLGNPSEAIDMLFEAKAIDEAADYQFRVQSINHHIAYVLESVGLFENSLVYYKEVLHYFNQQGELRQQAAVNETIGNLMMELQQLDSAKVYLNSSLELQQKSGMKTHGSVLVSLGDLALEQGHLEDASNYFDKAEPLLRENRIKKGFVLLSLGRADLYLARNEYNRAAEYVRTAVSISEKLELTELQMLSYEKLGVVSEKLGEFEEALVARDVQRTLNTGFGDKATALEVNRKLVEKKLAENEEKTSAIEESTSKESISNQTIMLLTLCFIGVIVVLFYHRRKTNKVKKGNHSTILNETEAENLVQTLEAVMEAERPYLNENLTLIQLAELVSTSQKKLSLVLNQNLNTNFYDYINRYRISAFKSSVLDGDFSDYSTLGIANACGFKSKSSFYRTFKKETGQSPGEYKKEILNKIVP